MHGCLPPALPYAYALGSPRVDVRAGARIVTDLTTHAAPLLHLRRSSACRWKLSERCGAWQASNVYDTTVGVSSPCANRRPAPSAPNVQRNLRKKGGNAFSASSSVACTAQGSHTNSVPPNEGRPGAPVSGHVRLLWPCVSAHPTESVRASARQRSVQKTSAAGLCVSIQWTLRMHVVTYASPASTVHDTRGARTSPPHSRQVLRFPLFAAAIFSRCSTVARLRCERRQRSRVPTDTCQRLYRALKRGVCEP